MKSITTVTQKGQVTLPVWVRRTLGVKPYDVVEIVLVGKEARVRSVEDVLDMAGMVQGGKGKGIMMAREQMEKSYTRV